MCSSKGPTHPGRPGCIGELVHLFNIGVVRGVHVILAVFWLRLLLGLDIIVRRLRLLPAREQALACLLGLLQQRSVLRVVAGVRLEGFKYPK